MWMMEIGYWIGVSGFLFYFFNNSTYFFRMLVLYEMFGMCVIYGELGGGYEGSMVLTLLSVFCVEATVGMSLLIYYSKFKLDVGSAGFV